MTVRISESDLGYANFLESRLAEVPTRTYA
jgi:hypothetical protein